MSEVSTIEEKNVYVIGIAGGSGSGKTTLVRALTEHFGSAITVISHDNYYKAYAELPFEERVRRNFDHPDAFETALLTEHLQRLKRGEAIECPVYDFTTYTRSGEVVRIEPTRVIVVEGILIFCDPALREEMDLRIFVDADSDVRLCRRVRRDVKNRGRSIDSVIAQYLDTVKPMHERFVEPSKRYAHLIIPEGGKNLVAREMLIERIRAMIGAAETAGL